MSSPRHPENLSSDGPTSLDRASVSRELSAGREAMGFCAGALAVTLTFEAVHVLPDLLQALQASDGEAIAQEGSMGLVIAAMSAFTGSKIHGFRNRRQQAQFNRQLIDIAEASGMRPTSE